MDKRQITRKSLSFDCTVVIDGAESASHVLDLSSGGARVRITDDVAVGQSVVLKLPDIGDFDADIRWVRNGTVGLAFQGDADDIAEQLYDFMVYGSP